MKSRRAWTWLLFTAAAAVLLGVMSWLTTTVMRLDRDELCARQQAAVHERLRLALWRMDSWLSPQLAREAMRPASEYVAFPSAPTAWTRGLTKIAQDEVLVKSPLLGTESALFPLHFEAGAQGLKSPQVPEGGERDACLADGMDRAILDRATARLHGLAGRISFAALSAKLGGAEALLSMVGCNLVSPDAPVQTQQSVNEYSNRQNTVNFNVQQQGPAAPPPLFIDNSSGNRVGPLVPVWIDCASPLLVFVRRVQNGANVTVQGVVVDWERLQQELQALVPDLFAAPPRLVPCEAPAAAEQPSMLASVPARVEAQFDVDVAGGLPLRGILWTTWGVTLLGLAVLGFTLSRAIGYGERRARFASAVTHELRTPLTTFRMYSEMLADGVVTEPAAQREYLTTLQRESDRLARVVENVLTWSRLEEGRFASRRERHDVEGLVARIVPPLQRRLADAGMTQRVQVHDSARASVVTTDEDAVGQILFNLADNAAKYARGAADATVELTVRGTADRVCFAVRDHGPGVPRAHRQRIFAPFDRGAVPTASNDVPGVGLGLALARGLARDLGGELRLDEGASPGACFVLDLPRA